MDNILNAVKLALRITTDAFNSELNDLIAAAIIASGAPSPVQA